MNEVMDSQLNYWRGQLSDLPALELPTDGRRSPSPKGRRASETFDLPPSLTAKLATFAQTENVSLSILLLASLYVLLFRYTQQDDIAVGFAVDRVGLDGEQARRDVLVFRANLSGDPQFHEFVRRVHDIAAQGLARGGVAFETLIEDLHPRRKLGENPLFQVLFDYREAVAASLPSGVDSVPLVNTAPELLSLLVHPRDRTLACWWGYDEELFEPATIDRISRHFTRILESVVAESGQTIGKLPLMSDAERRQVVVEWNETGVVPAVDRCVHQLFETVAESRPDAIAAVFEEDSVTYRDLDRRSNQLANHLGELGVRPETLVALCVDPSIDLIVGLLGILKAGGAYVPIDPAIPAERQEFFLRDSEVRFVVTHRTLVDSLSLEEIRPVRLDRDLGRIQLSKSSPPKTGVRPDNALYVTYTSGSTGLPKGVVVEHRQMVGYVCAAAERLELSAGLSFALLSSLGADLGNTALFPSLCLGGSLHLLSKDRGSDPRQLSEYFQRNSIDFLKVVPSHLAALLSSATGAHPLPRRRLVLGGEAASWDLIDKIKQLAPDCAIFNHYGPTETTVGAVAGRIDPTVERNRGGVPLGRPLSNAKVYLLDRSGQPVPVGASGEIFIGGDGVARGYFNRPELERQRFLLDRFSSAGEKRFYKTGDLGRYRSDGTIEFLGRADDQVKIRGFRIEPGEIEAVLAQHPSVLEVAVLAREETDGEKRLTAYVAPRSDSRLSGAACETVSFNAAFLRQTGSETMRATRFPRDTGAPRNGASYSNNPLPGSVDRNLVPELRSFLRAKLPEYMIPAGFVFIDRLPRLTNGKVNRRALADIRESATGASELFEEARNETERELARIWAEVLRLKRVGVCDNFFDLGGDSILSIHIVALAARVGIRITSRNLFEHQTIEQLATVAKCSESPGSTASQDLVTGPAPLTPIQRRFFKRNPPDPNHYNQSILLDAKKTINPNITTKAVAALLVHHDALRLQYEPGSAGWRQTNKPKEEPVPLHLHDLSEVSEPDRLAWVDKLAAEAQESLDIQKGPLLRVVLFWFGERSPSKLLFVFHHLVMDAVAETILMEDFDRAYGQLERGEKVVLPQKTTSFQSWAENLERHVETGGARDELSYWTDPRRVTRAALPVDFDSTNDQAAVQQSVAVKLNAAETLALLQEVPRAYHTQINDILCTAMALAFADWTGRRSLLLELEGHGREDVLEGVDLSRTVGWFTARFPVLLELPEGGIGEALKSIKEQLRRVPRKGIGYGLLRYLSPDADVRGFLDRMPPPQVSFNYLGQLDHVFDGSLFKRSAEPKGSDVSPEWKLPFLLDVNGGVTDGRLQFDWYYNSTVHRRSTVERVAAAFIEKLRTLIAHCLSPEAGGYTPSDFPQADMTQSELDDLLTGLG